MSDDHNSNPTTAYYVISGIFLTWNIIGLMLYYQQMTLTPEMLANAYEPAQAAFVQATPVWANAAYGAAVTFGLIGALLLLLRNKLAFGAYVVSIVGIVLQDLDSFVLRDGIALFGDGLVIYIVPPVVLIMAVIQLWYSRSVANRYYR